jgi:endonuclease-3
MRTSRISQETAKIVGATASSPSVRHLTRSSLARFARNGAEVVKEEVDEDNSILQCDIEDALLPPRKRKRAVSSISQNKAHGSSLRIKPETEDTTVISSSPIKGRVRKPARKVKDEETGEVAIHSPNDWAEVYALVKEMRSSPGGVATNAAVDTMGCASLAEKQANPRDKRFQTLIALMLSSQTKDTTNAVVMARLQSELPPYKPSAPAGLNLENILAVDAAQLNELIYAVGFHNNKTKYIKAAAKILRDQWGGDIPDTIDGLMALPGVGPKMAYLCMSVAWGRTEGIGVDVHVHRITNLWGWHTTKTPEETRLALQAWLPRELWHEINWLLVGLGQTVCMPVGRRCGDCEVGLNGLCKSAERAKVSAGRKAREERLQINATNGEVLGKGKAVKEKEELAEIAVPINATPDAGADGEGLGDVELPAEKGLKKEEEGLDLEEGKDLLDGPAQADKDKNIKGGKR